MLSADPYLNMDAGTMSPFEHGEVFVLDDGGEVRKALCYAHAAIAAGRGTVWLLVGGPTGLQLRASLALDCRLTWTSATTSASWTSR